MHTHTQTRTGWVSFYPKILHALILILLTENPPAGCVNSWTPTKIHRFWTKTKWCPHTPQSWITLLVGTFIHIWQPCGCVGCSLAITPTLGCLLFSLRTLTYGTFRCRAVMLMHVVFFICFSHEGICFTKNIALCFSLCTWLDVSSLLLGYLVQPAKKLQRTDKINPCSR